MAAPGHDSGLVSVSSQPVAVIIVAAGESRRMGGQDKIFAPLLGKPLLAWTVQAFQASHYVNRIVLVLHPQAVERGSALFQGEMFSKVVAVCSGGPRRQDSVREGLNKISDAAWVIIHDGARPCVDPEIIARGIKAAQETGAAIAAMPALDTIKLVSPDGFVEDTPPRSRLWAVQTPQVFRADLIRQAHEIIAEEVTDDSAMVEKLGHRVKIYPGSYENIKVTTPVDLAYAELILRSREQACGEEEG